MDGMEEHGEDRHKHLLNQVGTVEVAFQGLHRHWEAILGPWECWFCAESGSYQEGRPMSSLYRAVSPTSDLWTP